MNVSHKQRTGRQMMSLPIEEMNADHNRLGTYKFMGGQISCVPPAVVPSLETEVRELREINPYFMPLWVTNQYRGPNGQVVRTYHFAVGAELADPLFPRKPIRGLLLPTSPVYGVLPRYPVVLYDILDGLTEEERNFGALPRYEHVTRLAIEFARAVDWHDRHKSREQRVAERDRAQDVAEARPIKQFRADQHARLAQDDFEWRRAWGTANRIFVPRSFGRMDH